MIRKLSEREHILKRSGMYLGSSVLENTKEFLLKDGKFSKTELSIVPGLIKIFNELIDNSVDEHVRTNKEFASTIEVKIDSSTFSVRDNGRGIPVSEVEIEDGKKIYQPVLAWTHARAGSNFDDDNSSTIGTNGVGSMIASVFSKKFEGISDDGKNRLKVTCKDNNEIITDKLLKTSRRGVEVTIQPDLEKFGVSEITPEHIEVIKQRLLNLSVAYPSITFKLNGKKVKESEKNFHKAFGDSSTIITGDVYSIGFSNNTNDEFDTFSLVNGLNITKGGTHIDYVTNYVVTFFKNKLSKKYKTIKNSDIKRKLFVSMVLKDFTSPKYSSQTKEDIANSTKEVKEYFSDLDLEALAKKVYANKEILNSIVDYFKIAEDFKNKQELKKLSKAKKKIKSEKYIAPIKEFKKLFIVEGESALSGLLPSLGREDYGYYTLKGKPLNVITASNQKFIANKELTELYNIIINERPEQIVFATDQDLDGFHIRALLSGFIVEKLPEFSESVGMLQTPILGVEKDDKLVRWYYNMNDEVSLEKGEKALYYKGLGSHDKEDLKMIVDKDGIDKMIDIIDYSDKEDLYKWLDDVNADFRKVEIMNNDFDIAKS